MTFGTAPRMSGSKFGYPAVEPKPRAPSPIALVRELPAGSVVLGDGTDSVAGPVGIDLQKLVDGRLLIQGTSGAGKSWTLRRLLEQTAERVQQIIFDPEREFDSIAEKYGHQVVRASLLDPAAMAMVAQRVREHRLSVVIDLSDLDREGQMMAVAAAVSALVEAPREQWHPALVVIDEAHLFAPFGGAESRNVTKAATSAVVDLMSRGRKRGLTGILATVRVARLSKSVSSEALNFLIGHNGQDRDIRRAAELIGWDTRKAFDRLPGLAPGEFVVVGPAFSRHPAVVMVGSVQTRHRGATPAIAPVLRTSGEEAARLLDLGGLVEASASYHELSDRYPPGLKAVRAFIRDAAFVDAGRVWGALAPLSPQGATVAQLGEHLSMGKPAIAAALALLDRFGAVQFIGEGAGRAVRAMPDLLDRVQGHGHGRKAGAET